MTDLDNTEWECEIKIRRNGRLVRRSNVLGDDIEAALYGASTEISNWAGRFSEERNRD